MLFVSYFVILFAFSYASSSWKQSSAADHERSYNQTSNDKWALLLAMSNGYGNYRHQADVCHAYQILRAHGISDNHIVVMMADDIAYNGWNDYPGEIFNEPGGDNVYRNVPKDYTGLDVNVNNFLNVLMGNKQAMRGIGSGKVIESGKHSSVFVNMRGHGTTGLVVFENQYYYDYLRADDFNSVIKSMYYKEKYGEMAIYLGSCESGSMFDGLLSPTLNVYTTTSADPTEKAYACYWNSSVNAYLGGEYSTSWMEYVDQYGSGRTLEDQYLYVEKRTMRSYPQQYGDQTMQSLPISHFMGSSQVTTTPVSSHEKDKGGVASPDVPIAILLNKIASETDHAKKALLQQQLSDELQFRKDVQSTVYNIAAKLATTKEHLTELLQTSSLPRNFDCIEDSVKLFFKRCLNNKKSEYALDQGRVLANLCEMQGMDWKQIEDAITSTC